MILHYKIIFAFLLASYLDNLCLGSLGYTCPRIFHTTTIDDVKGCPVELPVSASASGDEYILAGRTWIPAEYNGMSVIPTPTYKIPELGCKGDCMDWFADTQTQPTSPHLFISVMVNPGCILHVFENNDFTGGYKNYTGPITIINPEREGPIISCQKPGVYKDMPCVGSMVWSCKQALPKCKFSDRWQTVAILDNTLSSSDEVQFTYEKQIGTEFSQSIEQSRKVSRYASLKLTAKFWLIAMAAKVSQTTHYNWGQVDSESKSDMKSYNVNVKVPRGTKIAIQEVIGECVQADGGITSIHTQMFRVQNVNNGKVLRQYNGKMTNYRISTKKGKWKG